MMRGIKYYMPAFTYFFAKYPNDKKHGIHASIVNVNDKMTQDEKADNAFVSFIQDMIEKTEDGATVIDPLNVNDHKNIVKHLSDSTSINRPGKVFQFTMTKSSKAVVNEQVRKHQIDIFSAAKRSDYDFLNHKLDELKLLHELLEQDFIKKVYDDCKRYVSQHLEKHY